MRVRRDQCRSKSVLVFGYQRRICKINLHVTNEARVCVKLGHFDKRRAVASIELLNKMARWHPESVQVTNTPRASLNERRELMSAAILDNSIGRRAVLRRRILTESGPGHAIHLCSLLMKMKIQSANADGNNHVGRQFDTGQLEFNDGRTDQMMRVPNRRRKRRPKDLIGRNWPNICSVRSGMPAFPLPANVDRNYRLPHGHAEGPQIKEPSRKQWLLIQLTYLFFCNYHTNDTTDEDETGSSLSVQYSSLLRLPF